MLRQLKNGRRIQTWHAVNIAHIDLIAALRYDDRTCCWIEPVIYRLRFIKSHGGWKRCYSNKPSKLLSVEEVRKILKRWTQDE